MCIVLFTTEEAELTPPCPDTLVELRLATDGMGLDQRLKNIMDCRGAKFPKSIDKQYDEIETEMIDPVAKPCNLSGGELDRILFQNYGGYYRATAVWLSH